MVVLDTSVVIDHLRQSPDVETHLYKIALKIPKEQLALSVISIQELYEGQSTKDPRKEESLLETITPLRVLPYTYETAQLAGTILRNLTSPIEFADAAIAATTILNGAKLLTLNQKDFKEIPDIELQDS